MLAGTTFGRAGRTALATLLLSLAAFGALATAGLPVLVRYLLLPAVLMIVLASAAVTGWTRVRAGGRAGAVAQAVAVPVIAALLVLAPAQIGRLDRLRDTLSAQAHIAADLHELAEDRGLTGRCPQMGVPSRRVVPQLALWLERSASSFTVGDAHRKGTYLLPATLRVARLATLDPREPVPAMPRPLPASASWPEPTRGSSSSAALHHR